MPHDVKPLTEKQVEEAFLAAPPAIAEQIIDLSVLHPVWLSEMYEVDVWPHGQGTQMQELIIRGARPQIERGFGKWAKRANSSGCDPCETDACSYNWTQFGGHGIDRKITELMSRDFRSPDYCIKEIETTAQFAQIFSFVVENLWNQISFFKEQNIGFNALTMLAKKFVVDSGGAKGNRADIYSYPNVGTTRLSALNITMLEFFYEHMRRLPDARPLDVQNGSPLFALISSHQLLADMYREDASLRQDYRHSSHADDLLSRFNFVTQIRDMFVPAPILYPRRFNIVNGEVIETLPFVNGIPAEEGRYTGFNTEYDVATHEEVLIHGMNPFKLMVLPTLETLGEGSSFGIDYEFFNAWQWVNNQTNDDPFRRVGFFATAASFGISQQFSEGIYGILVERPSINRMATFYPNPVCPPAPAACGNEITAPGCPVECILSVTPHAITAGRYFVQLSVPLDGAISVSDPINLGLSNGGFVTVTVEVISADRLTLEISSATVLPDSSCEDFTFLSTGETLVCSADVLHDMINCANDAHLDLTLSQPIKAVTATDTVTLFHGDGTESSADVVSVDQALNLWVVDTGSTFCDQTQGVVGICVPTATDASCPACGLNPTEAACTP